MLHEEFLPAGSFGGRATVDKQMHFQTYSHTGANSTNRWHCKNPVDSAKNWKCFVQLCRACPPLLTVILRASFLFTHSCTVSIIRAEAVNSPCLKTLKMWWAQPWKYLLILLLPQEVGLDLQRSMSTSAILWFCTRKLGRGIMHLELLGQGSSFYLWGHLCWILFWHASLHSTLRGHCWAVNAFPHPAVYKTDFLHCSSPPEHQRTSFHDQSLGSSSGPIFIN